MGNVIATADIKVIYTQLKEIEEYKRQIKAQEDLLKQMLHNVMLDNENLVSEDGELLLTWKYCADTFYLDVKTQIPITHIRVYAKAQDD